MATEKGAVMQSGQVLYDLIGSLIPGQVPLLGKSFYLNEVKSRPTGVITEVVGRLGGKVESFLHKDVSVVITGSHEVLSARSLDRSSSRLGKVRGEIVGSPSLQRDKTNNTKCLEAQKTPVCGSRGKALLEKAIRSNEKCRGDVLTSARSWGVKIVSVENFLKFVNQLTFELPAHKSKRTERKAGKSSALRIAKAGALKSDFLKIEDSSRKYRPLHAQSLSLPMLSFTGRFSPFEPLAPMLPPEKRKEGELNQETFGNSEEPISSCDKPCTPLPHCPSPRPARRKSLGYCECCNITYNHQEEHLQSGVHLRFVEDINNYAVVDQLVAGMIADFSHRPDQQDLTLLKRSPHCSPTPVSPAQLDHLTGSETERACRAITNRTTDQLITSIEPAFGPVCVALLLEPGAEIPSQTGFKSKTLPSQPRPKAHFPSPPPQLPSCVVLPDCELAPHIPHNSPVSGSPCSPGLGCHLADVEYAHPKHFEIPGPSIDYHQDLSASSNHPKQQLSDCHGREALDKGGRTLITNGTLVVPVNVCLTEKDQSTLRSAWSYCSTFLSTAVNSRKRSRSFTFSPRLSKKMRTCGWSGQKSDQTYQNSAVSVRFGEAHGGGLVPSAEKSETRVPTASDSVQFQNYERELQHGDPPPAKSIQQCTPTNTASQQDQISVFFQQNLQSNHEAQEMLVTELNAERTSRLEFFVSAGVPADASSELGPPQLYPFYHEDLQVQQQPSFANPPKLAPAVPLLFPSEKSAHLPKSQTSSTSLLSQSFSSVCIESALIPDFTLSPVSSESDWDSGLLSRFAPSGKLQARGGPYEQDIGVLLQRSCVRVQDGNYDSQLCSVLQPSISSTAAFRDAMSLNSLYRPVEVLDGQIIQSLGI